MNHCVVQSVESKRVDYTLLVPRFTDRTLNPSDFYLSHIHRLRPLTGAQPLISLERFARSFTHQVFYIAGFYRA